MANDVIYVKGKDLLNVFNSQDWDGLYIQLEAYIIYVLRHKYGIVKTNEQLKTKADEIISEVMELIFVTGTRNWCKENCPDFKSFLFGVVKSHIYDGFKAKNKNKEDLSDIIEDENNNQNNIQDTITEDELRATVFNELKNLSADDDELLVFECMADGIIKPEKIREELGIEPAHLNNILRRLSRKTSKIKNKIFNK